MPPTVSDGLREPRHLRRERQVTRGQGSRDCAAAGVRAPVRSAPMPAATTKAIPSSGPDRRHLVEQQEADDERDRRLQAHQRAERRGGEPAQGQHLEANGTTGSSRARPSPTSTSSGVSVGDHALRAGDHGRDQRGDRDGQTARPWRPATWSPTAWVSRMYAAQQAAAPSAKRDPDRVRAALPRLGEQQHADRGERRPQPAAGRAAPGDGHAERAEELQRARGPERQPLHRRHEQHGHPGGDDAQRDAATRTGRLNEAGRGRTSTSSRTPGPGQPQPGRALRRRSGRTARPTRPGRAGRRSSTPTAIAVPARAVPRGECLSCS